MIDIIAKWSSELNTVVIFQQRDFNKVKVAQIIAEGVDIFDTLRNRQYCIRARSWTLNDFAEEVETCKAIGMSVRESQYAAMEKVGNSIKWSLDDQVIDSPNYYATLETLLRDLVSALADK
jgi:hypothetical protein